MAASLRTRLWWSYTFVTTAALSVVALVLVIYIIQNPSTYRLASARLTVVAALLRKNEASLSSSNESVILNTIQKADAASSVRIIVYNRKRQVVADSRAGVDGIIRMPLLPRLRVSSVLRDQNNAPWIYIIQRLSGGGWLMVAVPRPAVPLLSILGDELFLPVFIGAAVAFFASLFLAFWLARWIGSPLQQLVTASRHMPQAISASLGMHGPREVQELTHAFNEMNTRVLSSQDSQRNFIADVSHELKTPLTSIQGFSQALLDGTTDTSESRRQAAQVIFDEAGRMHRLVLDLLELASLDAGTLELQYAPVDITALLNNIATRFEPQAGDAGVGIQVESGVLPVVQGDGDRLSQVFINLVDNALKYTTSGGRITLCAHQDGDWIQVEVSDTGTGIPAAALPHIFERFYQADPSRRGGKKHGSGLGLAIVREIVVAHGGKISVRSKERSDLGGSEGSGTSFIVMLPLSLPDKVPPLSSHKKV
jgi:signal transduction histidine kinase